MTIAETLLPKLSEWQPPGEGRQLLTVVDECAGWGVAVTVDRQESMGCQVWDLTMRRLAPLPASAAGLQAWADRIAKRVTSLLERLKVVEVDVERNEALLRSVEPAQRGDDLFYYEALLKGTNEAALRRYHVPHKNSAHREQIRFALTHEALAKLAADLAMGE